MYARRMLSASAGPRPEPLAQHGERAEDDDEDHHDDEHRRAGGAGGVTGG